MYLTLFLLAGRIFFYFITRIKPRKKQWTLLPAHSWIAQDFFWMDTCSTGQSSCSCRRCSQSQIAVCESSRGYYSHSEGLAGWVYEYGRLPLRPGPQRIAQLNELSRAAGWLPGTFQFTTLHTWSHGGLRVEALKGRKVEIHNQAHKTEG